MEGGREVVVNQTNIPNTSTIHITCHSETRARVIEIGEEENTHETPDTPHRTPNTTHHTLPYTH